MAYIQRQQSDEEQQPGQQPTSSLLAGFGPAPSPAAASPAPAAGGEQQGSSAGGASGYVPFSAYKKANEGASKQMAGDVAGRVGGDAEKAQQSQYAAQSEFAGQVAAGSPFGGPAPTGVLERINSWRPGTATQAAPAQRTTARAATPQAPQIGRLTGYADIGLGSTKQGGGAPVYAGASPEQARANAAKQYTGPTSIDQLESWRNTGAQTQAAQDELAATADPYGLEALVGRQYGSTGGGGRLDAALTSSAGGGTFDALRAKYGDLVGARREAGARMDQNASDAATKTRAIAGRWGDQVRDYDAGEQWARDRLPGGINYNPPPDGTTPQGRDPDYQTRHAINDFGGGVADAAAIALPAMLGPVGGLLAGGIKGVDKFADDQLSIQDEIAQWNYEHPNGPTWAEAHPGATIFNPRGN